jgi:hypothetical protein
LSAAIFYWLANTVALTHGLLVIAVVCGSFAAAIGTLRLRPKVERVYYAVVAALIASDIFLGGCALTNLEKWLLESSAPGSAYQGSYLGHYFTFLPPVVHDRGGPALVVIGLLAFPGWRVRDFLANRRMRESPHASADRL